MPPLLTASGTAGAIVVGALALAATGWPGLLLLFAFFLPSSLVSRVSRPPEGGLDPKGEQRDAWQVFANGLAPSLGAALAAWAGALDLAWMILLGGLSVAAADTWATAIGSRSRRPPRHLLTGRTVPRGTNGGVTILGTIGAAAGALVVGFTALVGPAARPVLSAIIIGVAGMFLDAALGSALQGRFHCERCDQPSEWPRHRCGNRTVLVGGIAWLTNDAVNAMATLAGALAGAAWWALSPR
ncbi:MAG TPA: DUF92 domain-containing protein [Gemmatimonadales bacterium]|nr:DUF92 domain-containing protein [Gemmatimonadales bacterium]